MLQQSKNYCTTAYKCLHDPVENHGAKQKLKKSDSIGTKNISFQKVDMTENVLEPIGS